jgi:hypothetical protein
MVPYYNTKSTTKLLPANCIVFSETQPSSNFVAFTEGSDKFIAYYKTGGLAAGTTTGANNYSMTTLGSTSSSGNHDHGNSTINQATSSAATNPFNGFAVPATAGAHTHTDTYAMRLYQQYLTMNTWRATVDTPLVNGMIIGYRSTSSKWIPTNWYVCNGQTVKGYVTPNLVNRYPLCSIGSHNANNISTYDYNGYDLQYTGSTTVTHAHNPSTSNYVANGTYGANHTSFAWSHTHSFSGKGFDYEPPSRGICFIIYLP